uniref:RdRp n=1 Tax=viral metagenome TaxID=1070528 RepID=A0A2V0R9U0_9ZZZZ
MTMRGSLYSGTPVTQVHGSIIHAAYLECLREHFGVDIEHYTILSDDGMCYYNRKKVDAQRDLADHFIPFADRLNLVMNDKKSYIADLNVKKVMLSADGEKIVRCEAGPYLSKFLQPDADESYGNVARLGRSLLGKERKTEIEAGEMLLQLLPGLRRTAKGDRNVLSSWVPDFWRTLEVMAQIRPGYPRRREFIKKVVGLYPNFWKYYDRLVEASASSGDVLFDTPTIRPGGTSEKGTVRWLIRYLNEVRDTGKWPV